MHLARRAQSVSGSATLELGAKVAELRAQGRDIISLAAGEPDFPSPPEALAAARAFLEKGHVKYTPGSGLPELRKVAAEWVSAQCGAEFGAGQLHVTCGAKEALALALMALAGQGDEVIVPTPAWISYEPMVALADAKAVTVPCRAADGYKLSPAALAGAITSRTRALLFNSPNNPTGAVYTAAEIDALAAVLAKHPDITVISDEIYSPFLYVGRHVSPAAHPALAGRVVVVNGVSKVYSMTGWRIGFLAGPKALADAVGNLKSHVTSNASTPAQVAALAALQAGDGFPKRMLAAFGERRRAVLAAIAKMPGVQCAPPDGAFYVWLKVDALYGGRVNGSAELARLLLDEVGVAGVPGAAFGEDRCLRFSIAASDAQLAEGFARIGRCFASLAGAGAPRA